MSLTARKDELVDPTEALEEVIDGFVDLVRPFVRIYLGPAAPILEGPQPGPETDGKLMLAALHKFMVEAGTLPPPATAYEPHTGTYSVDPDGQAPALDLRHVLAALRVLAAWAAAGPAATVADPGTAPLPGKQPPPAPRGFRLAAAPGSAAPPPAYAPVSARELRISARTTGYALASPSAAHTASGTTALVRTAGGCGCPAPAAPPAPEACTPWSPSCEARNRLRACLKDILCELLRCIEEFICPGGSFGTTPLSTRRVQLVSCIAELLCKLLRCVREALCPPPPAPELPCPPPDCLPCSYAVEDPR